MSGAQQPDLTGYEFAKALKQFRTGPAVPMVIVGDVNLSFWQCDREIVIERVTFLGPVNLTGAKLAALSFVHCRFHQTIDGSCAEIAGNLFIQSCEVVGSKKSAPATSADIQFNTASIGGNVEISANGRLSLRGTAVTGDCTIAAGPHGPGYASIDLDGAKVSGAVAIVPRAGLQGSFDQNSDARLQIAGLLSFNGLKSAVCDVKQVDCRSAILATEAHFDRSLTMEAVKVQGQVTLDGTVSPLLVLTDVEAWDSIDTQQSFIGINRSNFGWALLTNVRTSALNANWLRVDTMVRMTDCALEKASFAGAQINGQLDIASAQIRETLSFNGAQLGSLWIGSGQRTFEEPTNVKPTIIGCINAVDSVFASYVRFSRLTLTGQGASAAVAPGMFFSNCSFDSGIRYWHIERPVKAPDPDDPANLDKSDPNDWQAQDNCVAVAGDVVLKSCQIETDLDLTRLRVSPLPDDGTTGGEIRIEGTQIGGKLAFGLPHPKGGEPDPSAGRASASRLVLNDSSAGEVDLFGLDIGHRDAQGRCTSRADIDGERLQVAGTVALYAPGLERTAQSSCGVQGALRLPAARLGELRLTAHSFQGGPDCRAGSDGIVLEAASIDRLRVPRVDFDKRKGVFPVPLDLAGLQVTNWFFGVDDDGDPCTNADDYLDFLDADEQLHREVYQSVAATLTNMGQDRAAEAVRYTENYRAHLSKCQSRWHLIKPKSVRERAPWHSDRKLGRLARVVGFSLRNSWWNPLSWFQPFTLSPVHFFYRTIMGYGRNLFPLLGIILFLGLASLALVARDPRNFELSPDGIRKLESPATAQMPVAALRELEPNGWGWGDGLFMTLRYHIPVVGLAVRGEFEPSNQALYLPYLCDRPCLGRPSPAGATTGPQEVESGSVTAEDWFSIMALLNWVLWPLLLTFSLRKVLRT